MRQQIEALIAEYEAVVRERQGIDRVAEPRVWAEVDLDCSAAAGRLGGEVREAARKLGLTRDLSRALAGTGYGVARLAFDPDHRHLGVELHGGPSTPGERRKAADPATVDHLRAVTEDFFSRTGIEVTFPYDRLAA
jgi:hypothetical protein